jgi:hypothetical protein
LLVEQQDLQPSKAPVHAKDLRARVESALDSLKRLTALHESAFGPDAAKLEVLGELRNVSETLTAVFQNNAELCEGWVKLASALEHAHTHSEAERRLLVEQQDTVLESLLDEHERQVLALEHESRSQLQQIALLQEHRDELNHIVEGLRRSTAQARRPPTPRTWPPDLDSCDTPSKGSDDGKDLRATVARLAADRDHLREGVRRLKEQRDEAQQETLSALEQVQAIRAELEELRALLPSVTAPPACPTTPPGCPSPAALPALALPASAHSIEGPHHPSRSSNPGPPPPTGPVTSSPESPHTQSAGGNDASVGPGKPQLKRKPDPTVSALGCYSVAGSGKPEDLASPRPGKAPSS